jgi:hypothetical protein
VDVTNDVVVVVVEDVDEEVDVELVVVDDGGIVDIGSSVMQAQRPTMISRAVNPCSFIKD